MRPRRVLNAYAMAPKKQTIRTMVLSVRLTDAEYAKIARAAERAALGHGTWARIKLLAAVRGAS